MHSNQYRFFDWANGKNEPGAGSYRLWLDGDEVPQSFPVASAIVPAAPGVDGPGNMSVWAHDDEYNIVANSRYEVAGDIRWEYGNAPIR